MIINKPGYPLITVIVPVYNVERYLEKCVNSLINQTYEDLEIILIDDGSSDSSGMICDQYAAVDHRVKVLHKTNGGLSDARNAGINVAKGEYIAFIDSDDYVAPGYIEKLYISINKYHAQLSVCSFALVSEEGSKIKDELVTIEEQCVCGREILKEVLMFYGYKYVIVCNKLYQRDIFSNLRFEKGKLYEDEFINFKLLWDCKAVSLVPDPLYFYFQRQGSIKRSDMSISKLEMKREFQLQRIIFFEEKNDTELRARSIQVYCNWLTNCFVKYRDVLDKEYIKKLQTDMRKYAPAMLKNKNVATREKIQDLIGIYNLAFGGRVKAFYKLLKSNNSTEWRLK